MTFSPPARTGSPGIAIRSILAACVVVLASLVAIAPAPAVNTVIATITTGGNPAYAVATPDGLKVYATDSGGTSVYVIDTATNTVSSTITVGAQPTPIAISPDGTRVYVGNWGDGTISVIDTFNDSVVATVAGSGDMRAIAVTPNGAKFVVTDLAAGRASVFATANNALLGTAVTGAGAQRLAISPDSSTAYVSNLQGNSVSFVNLTTLATTSLAVASAPRSMALSPDGAQLYVGHSVAPEITAISTGTRTITGTVTTGYRADALAVTDNRVFAAAHQVGSVVAVVDTATLSLLAVAPVADKARQLLLAPNASTVYSVGDTTGTVTAVSTSANEVLASIPVGTSPVSGAFLPDGSRLYVTNAGGSLTVIDTYIAPSATRDPSQDPKAPLQQFSVPADTAASGCGELAPVDVDWPGIADLHDRGWAISYADWPNGGTGGWVCSRQPLWLGNGWGFTSN